MILASCASQPIKASGGIKIDYRFVGDDSFHDFNLRRVIEDMLLDFSRHPGQESLLVDAASDLQDWYVSQGFPEAQVQYRIDRERKPLRVVFRSMEGPRVTVTKVHIKNNHTFRAKELLPLWSRTRSGLLGLADPYFVEADLRAFALAMRSKYVDHGYLDAKVTGPLVERKPGSSYAKVSFDIHEGPRFTLRSLSIDKELSRILPNFDLRGIIERPYDLLELQGLRGRFRKQLQDLGYPDPSLRIEIEVTRDPQAKRFEVRAWLRGKTGPRRKVSAIRVAGNERTATYIIRRHIHAQPGQFYKGSQVAQSLRELYVTGLFSKVEVERSPASSLTRDNPDADILTFRVTEVEAREVAILAGYGSYERARSGIFFTDRNLFGIGQSLRVAGKLSQKSFGTDATWNEASLLGSDTGLSITAFHKQRQEPAFTDTSSGLSAAFMRRLAPATQARLGYSFENRDGSNIDASIRSLVEADFQVGKLFFELIHDSRDSQIFPRNGHRGILRYEHAKPLFGGDLAFDRLTVQSSWNFELPGSMVLSLAAQAGLIWPDKSGVLPIQERFFSGGNASVRSFKASQLGPRTVFNTPSGGQYRNVFNVELRVPLFGPFEGALFADAGNVGRDVRDFGLSNLRYALGSGLRFILPIGPVRLDAAMNPDPQNGERDWTLHLSVGYPF